MSNVLRKPATKPIEASEVSANNAIWRTGLLRLFLPLFGLFLALASAHSGLIYLELLNPTGIKPYIEPITIIALITLAAFVAPAAVGALSLIITLLYLSLYSIPSYMTQAFIYGVCTAFASWLLAGRLLRGSLKTLAADNPRLILSQALFFITVFSQAFVLLAVKTFHQPVLFSTGVLWALILCLVERREIVRIVSARPNITASYSRLTGFFFVGILLLLEFSAVLYLYPGAIGGDSDKGYIALAKFFTRGNSLILTDPAVLRDAIRSFPYFEEIYLAAGYLLSANFGAKLFAWLIVVSKFSTLYFVVTRVLSLSSGAALGLVLCYGLMPHHLEIHAIQRPENVLTIFMLLLVYLIERARGSLERKDQSSFERLIITAGVLSCVIISIKYTALFFLVGLAVVYWRSTLKTLLSVVPIFRRGYLILLPSLAVAAFWYIRNIVLWGEVVSITPYGRYHLTVMFPPLHGVADIWLFIRDSLVHTAQYTEFGNFAYGFFGVVFWGGVVAALAIKGSTRRFALLVLLYSVLLFSSTRQIRYLLPLLPFGLAAIFALCKSVANSRSGHLVLRIAEPLVFLAILIQAVSALIVNFHGVAGQSFRERIRLVDKDLTRNELVYSVINDIVKYPELILTSHYDANYSLDAKMLRADPLTSIGALGRKAKDNGAGYFLLASPGVDPRILFFNDTDFFDSIADFKVDSVYLSLFKAVPEKLDRLARYIEQQGWQLDQTLIISEKLKHSFPFFYITAEEIRLPGLKHRLYRVAAMRWSGGNLRKFGQTETFNLGADIASYFEDGLSPAAGKALSSQRVVENLEAYVESGKSLLRTVGGAAGKLHYKIDLSDLEFSQSVVVDVYARLQTTQNSTTLVVEEVSKPLPAYVSLDTWQYLDSRMHQLNSKEPLDISLEFQAGQPQIIFRGLRVIIRNPNELLEPLPFVAARLEEGKPMKRTAKLFWLSETFSGTLKASANARFETEREGVRVKKLDNNVSVMAAVRTRGYKKYQFKLPPEIREGGLAKIYLSGKTCGSSGQVEVITSLVSATGAKEVCQKEQLKNLDSSGQVNLVSDCDFASSRIKPEAIEVNLMLDGSGKSSCAVVDDLIMVVGQSL